MKDNIGYGELRTAAGDPAVFGNGNGSIGTSSMRALRDPGGNCIVKMSRGDVTWSCQGYGLPFPPRSSSSKRQASSVEAQASSVKPQATSSMMREPRKSFTSPEPRAWTMINVLCGCFT